MANWQVWIALLTWIGPHLHMQFAESAPNCRIGNGIITLDENVEKGTVLLSMATSPGSYVQLKQQELAGYLLTENFHNYSNLINNVTLDLEDIGPKLKKNTLQFKLACLDNQSQEIGYTKQIWLNPKSEFKPQFSNKTIYLKINENIQAGSAVVSLRKYVTDADYNENEEIKEFGFNATSNLTTEDFNVQKFRLNKRTGEISVAGTIDYEELMFRGYTSYKMVVYAKDVGGLQGNAILQIEVLDVDDQGPQFIYPQCPRSNGYCVPPLYETTVHQKHEGKVKIHPAEIHAKDKDTINYKVRYRFIKAIPQNSDRYFSISPVSGKVSKKQLPSNFPNTVYLYIQAEEVSTKSHREQTWLRVSIKPEKVIMCFSYGFFFGTTGPLLLLSFILLTVICIMYNKRV